MLIPKRLAFVIIAIFIGALLLVAVGSTAFLAAWMPRHGAAWVKTQVERSYPAVEVSVGPIRYEWMRGFIIEEVRATERRSGETWVRARAVRFSVALWPLLRRQVAFKAQAALNIPAPTGLQLTGRYDWPQEALDMRATTEEIPVKSLTGPLARMVPPSTNGTLRLDLRLTRAPGTPSLFSGEVVGTDMAWSAPRLRLTGDVALTGSAAPPPVPGAAWTFDGHAALRSGTARLPLPGPLGYVTDIEGEADLTQDQVTIRALSGRVLESPWRLEGTVARTGLEALLTADVPLKKLSDALSPFKAQWEPAGESQLRMVCRAAYGAEPLVDCLAQAQLQDAGLTGPRQPGPVTGINGRLSYDHLEKRLVIEDLQAQLLGEPLWLRGEAWLVPFALAEGGESARLTGTVGFAEAALRVAARLAPYAWLIDEARLSLPHSRLTLTGTLARGARAPSALALRGSVDVADLGRVPFVTWPKLETWKLRGVTEVDAQLEGRAVPWRDATLRGTLRAEQLSVRDLPLRRLVCEFEQRGGLARATVPAALFGGGKLTGQLDLNVGERDAPFHLEVDLTAVQLAQLRQAIPAWRQSAAEGSASAHLSLGGPWRDRAQWRGDGWLTATGEQLGSVPLLERIFRGLFGVLAGRLGLETLRRAQITQVAGRWQLDHSRVRTEDLRISGLAGAEPVSIYAKGSVGLDQTLDFVIEPEFSEQLVLQAPTVNTFATTVLKFAGGLDRLRRYVGRHRLTGTLKQPDYAFEVSLQELLKQLFTPSADDLLQDVLQKLP